MAMCEKCWGDAYILSRWNGKSQAVNYVDLLEERKDNLCTPEQQSGKDREKNDE